MQIVSYGSNKKSVGNIYFNAQNNTNLHCRIDAGDSCILPGRYTIPRGYKGFLDTLNLICTTSDQVEVAVLRQVHHYH